MKKTIRHNIFETNSSTEHTLTLNDSFYISKMNLPKPEDIKEITLMKYDEWFDKEHFGILNKFRAILTDGVIAHHQSGAKKIMKDVVNMFNKRYNANAKIVINNNILKDWNNYSDGNKNNMIDFSGIEWSEKSDEAYNIPPRKLKPFETVFRNYASSLNIYEDYVNKELINVSMSGLIENKEHLLELIINDKFSIKIHND